MTTTSVQATKGGDLSFEAQLFRAADKLRGNMEPSDYKHVALGLIFLKYISDAFSARHAELLAEYPEGAEDPDEYLAENVFWVPEDARWSHLQANAKQPTVGRLVVEAMLALEKVNPSLKGVLPKEYGLDRYAELWLGALGAAPHKLPQTLLFAPPGAKTLGEPAFSAAPYAAATSGLAASFATSSPAVCTVTEAGLVTLVGAGTCTLTSSQLGAAAFAAASSVTRSFAVTVPPAETYLIDFEKAPANLVYSVKLGGGVAYTGAGIPRTGTVPVVGKCRVNGTVLSAHLARVVSLYGSKRLTVVSPNTSTPAPQGGRLKLSFTNLNPKGVTLTSLTLSDLTAAGAHLTLYYADGTSSRQLLGAAAKGGGLKVPLAVKGVVAVEVFAPTAFAVDDVAFSN